MLYRITWGNIILVVLHRSRTVVPNIYRSGGHPSYRQKYLWTPRPCQKNVVDGTFYGPRSCPSLKVSWDPGLAQVSSDLASRVAASLLLGTFPRRWSMKGKPESARRTEQPLQWTGGYRCSVASPGTFRSIFHGPLAIGQQKKLLKVPGGESLCNVVTDCLQGVHEKKSLKVLVELLPQCLPLSLWPQSRLLSSSFFANPLEYVHGPQVGHHWSRTIQFCILLQIILFCILALIMAAVFHNILIFQDAMQFHVYVKWLFLTVIEVTISLQLFSLIECMCFRIATRLLCGTSSFCYYFFRNGTTDAFQANYLLLCTSRAS